MAVTWSSIIPSHLERRLLGRVFVLIAALALFTVLPGAIAAADPRQATVLVIVQSSSKNDNKALNALIADSFRLELESKGIRAVPVSERASDDKAAGALAARNSADFALWGTYLQTGPDIQLSARWVDAGRANATGQASRSGALDLSFDAMVTSLVDEIMEGQKQSIANLPPAPVLPAAKPAPAPKPEPASPVKEARIPPFALSLSSSPFIATFTALNYFPVGITVSVAGHYQMRAPGGLFGIGATSGLSGFHGKGSYASADFYVVPIGVDALYGTRTGSPFDFYVHLSGGPAIFSARLTTGESLSKVIPFLSGGVGISVALLDALALSLEAGYTGYLDSPDPIMGFAPALSVDLRL
jgi:hypothetical protein